MKRNLVFLALLPLALALVPILASAAEPDYPDQLDVTLRVPEQSASTLRVPYGQTLQISVAILEPSQLPSNGRLRVSWELVTADDLIIQNLSELSRPIIRQKS